MGGGEDGEKLFLVDLHVRGNKEWMLINDDVIMQKMHH